MLPHAAAADACASFDFATARSCALWLILSRLELVDRLRCASVRRSWRAAAADPRLWTRLTLPYTGTSDGLLGAAARLRCL
jgi:hypothetical protein